MGSNYRRLSAWFFPLSKYVNIISDYNRMEIINKNSLLTANLLICVQYK